MAEVSDEDFQSAFWNAKRAMMEAHEAAFRKHGVRAGQQHILKQLWKEDCQTPGQLARTLDLSVATVSKMTSRMEGSGLVGRHPHPSDGRLVRVCLTERGRALKDAIGGEIKGVTEHALATLGPRERKQFVRYLHAVRESLERTAVPLAS
jgi:DNA-binding MarR family transcriptional regulator